MLFRLSHLDSAALYREYNAGHPGWPDNLPPPPNPDKLRSFTDWCIQRTIEQLNEENDPEKAKKAQQAQQERRQMRP